MSAFKFGFVVDREDENEEERQSDHATISCSNKSLAPAAAAVSLVGQEVVIESFHRDLLQFLNLSDYTVKHSPPTHTIHYVTCAQIKLLLERQPISDSESAVTVRTAAELGPLLFSTDSLNSDLIPNQYEGGMKVWECAYDLVDYLMSEKSIPLSESRVLELGCGVGLPGVAAMLCGATSVHFQDFNREVLSFLTIPSVLANLSSEDATDQIKFYFGDWDELVAAHCQSGEVPYDVILTSETIYSVSSQPKLLRTLKKLTNPIGGLVVMAAKSHYFGVGGSVSMFSDLVRRDGYFNLSVAKIMKTSISRHIMLLTPKES